MNMDARAELAHTARDPQFFDEEAVDEDELNRKWECLRDQLDQASVLIKDIYETSGGKTAMVTSALIESALERTEEALYG